MIRGLQLAVPLALLLAVTLRASDSQQAIIAELKAIAASNAFRPEVTETIAKLDAEHFIEGMRALTTSRHPGHKSTAHFAIKREQGLTRVAKDKLGAVAMEFLPIDGQPMLEVWFLETAIECKTPGAVKALEAHFAAARTERERFDAVMSMRRLQTPEWRKHVVDFLNTNTDSALQGDIVAFLPPMDATIDQPDTLSLIKTLQILLIVDTKPPRLGGRRIADAAAQSLALTLRGFVWSLMPGQRKLLDSAVEKDRDQYIALLDKWLNENIDHLEKQWRDALAKEVGDLNRLQSVRQPDLDAMKQQLEPLVGSDFSLQTALDSPEQLAFIKSEVERWWDNGKLKTGDAVASAKAVEHRVKARWVASTQPAK